MSITMPRQKLVDAKDLFHRVTSPTGHHGRCTLFVEVFVPVK